MQWHSSWTLRLNWLVPSPVSVAQGHWHHSPWKGCLYITGLPPAFRQVVLLPIPTPGWGTLGPSREEFITRLIFLLTWLTFPFLLGEVSFFLHTPLVRQFQLACLQQLWCSEDRAKLTSPTVGSRLNYMYLVPHSPTTVSVTTQF